MPPEKGGTRERLRQIASNPLLAAHIVADVVRSPLPGPTLGFRFSHPAGPAVLFYGEGLHAAPATRRSPGSVTRCPPIS